MMIILKETLNYTVVGKGPVIKNRRKNFYFDQVSLKYQLQFLQSSRVTVYTNWFK